MSIRTQTAVVETPIYTKIDSLPQVQGTRNVINVNGRMLPLETAWIINVSPVDFHLTLPYAPFSNSTEIEGVTVYGVGIGEYLIPGAPSRETFSATQISNAIAKHRRMIDMDYTQQQEFLETIVPVAQVANDILQAANGPSIYPAGGSGIGAFYGEGTVPEDVIDNLRASYSMRCNFIVERAQDLARTGFRSRIGGVARKAAYFLHGTKAKEIYDWYSPDGYQAFKSCIGCEKQLKPKATVCPDCGDLVDLCVRRVWDVAFVKGLDEQLGNEYAAYIERYNKAQAAQQPQQSSRK